MALSVQPRIAIVHDYLTQMGGAERVALAMVEALPSSRLVTSFYAPKSTFPGFAGHDIQTMALNRVAPLRREPRLAMPLLARRFERLHVEDAEVLLCSSSGWAHGTSTDAPKIVYCHNPARWLYQPDDYFGRLAPTLRKMFERRAKTLREWDKSRAHEAELYLVNSTTVRDRVREHYGIDARVLPPAAGITPDGPSEPIPGIEPGFLLSVARHRGYKNVESVAEAVEALPGERLVAVGGLPKRHAGGHWGERLVGLPQVSDAQLRWLYTNAAALVANSAEDFGLTPVEAFGFGTPVLAVAAGGYLDSCVPGLTGVAIEDTSTDGTIDAITRFRQASFDSHAIRTHAVRWSPERFAKDLNAVVDEVLAGSADPSQAAYVEAGGSGRP